jgi:hypothetical protein
MMQQIDALQGIRALPETGDGRLLQQIAGAS